MSHLVKATEVTAGLADSNGSILPGLWRDSLHVTCGLTACTPGSAPGPTLGNEYGKTFFTTFRNAVWCGCDCAWSTDEGWHSWPSVRYQCARCFKSLLSSQTSMSVRRHFATSTDRSWVDVRRTAVVVTAGATTTC